MPHWDCSCSVLRTSWTPKERTKWHRDLHYRSWHGANAKALWVTLFPSWPKYSIDPSRHLALKVLIYSDTFMLQQKFQHSALANVSGDRVSWGVWVHTKQSTRARASANVRHSGNLRLGCKNCPTQDGQGLDCAVMHNSLPLVLVKASVCLQGLLRRSCGCGIQRQIWRKLQLSNPTRNTSALPYWVTGLARLSWCLQHKEQTEDEPSSSKKKPESLVWYLASQSAVLVVLKMNMTRCRSLVNADSAIQRP